MVKLSDRHVKELNNFAPFTSYVKTWIFRKFVECPMDILALFYGNQAGKGAAVIMNYILRLFGSHPVPKKNVLYYECETAINYNKAKMERKDLTGMPEGHCFSPVNIKDMKFGDDPYNMKIFSDKYICPHCHTKITPHIREGSHRIIRFASERLPNNEATVKGKKNLKRDEMGMSETKNTQFIELMKWLPRHMLREDKKITVRDADLYVKDIFGLGDIIFEFMSFNQVVQGGAGHQRLSTWADELGTLPFYQEQVPRLLAVDGADMILSYTVTKEVGYLFDMIWNRARKIYRSRSVVEYYKNRRNEILPREEETDSEFENIAVFHASSYDNPTLDPDRIDNLMKLLHSDCDNEDVMDMRKYCIFSEISAFIFPTFDMRTHVIKPEDYFTPQGEVILN